jgi:hypothetical protein
VNLPVLLSLLFVIQFVPFEHFPCLSNHNPVRMMDCHGRMAGGVHMAPASEAGLAACCGESVSLIFTLPSREMTQLDSRASAATSVVADLALSSIQDVRESGSPPGFRPPVQSVDRTVVFASFLI